MDISTIGLLPDWSGAFEWADKHHIRGELIRVVNLTLLKHLPGEIGHVLGCIGTGEAVEILRDWSNETTDALPLLELGQAAFHDRLIFSVYPRPTLTASRKLFFGKLETHYLLALLSERTPRVSLDSQVWLTRLRLWILVHAIHRSRTNNFQDNWIRFAATRLRMAFDRDNEWRKLFCDVLSSSALDFEEINRFLIYKSERLLAEKHANAVTSTERQLLHALIKIASKTDGRDDSHPDLPSPIELDGTFCAAESWSAPAVMEEISDQDEEGELTGAIMLADDDLGLDLVSFGVDARESFTHQRLRGNAILLHGNEENQFLPWSWQRPNHIEAQRVLEWLATASTSPARPKQLVACFVWLALALGRTFRRTLDICLTSAVLSEWSLDPATMLLQRLPPRREGGWMPRSEQELAWVTPSAHAQTLSMPPHFAELIKERVSAVPEASRIGGLWSDDWGTSPEGQLRHELDTPAPRLTGSMLGSYLPMLLYSGHEDHVLARLLASHPSTALPAACAYSSWSSKGCELPLGSPPSSLPDSDNAMGSLLDPIEERLQASIREATNKLDRLRISADMVGFHNTYVTYLSVALLAGTGCRPIRDLYEKHSHFDFDQRFAFVDDKHSGEIRQARLVALPDVLCQMVGNDYISHLQSMSTLVAREHSGLAASIRELLQPNLKATMPFLFLISEKGEWQSVSEQGVGELGLFDWPLPLNLFRHRLSKQLRRSNVEAEIIDSILGHAEGGSATHGDFSLRTWQQDMDVARPAIEGAFNSLGFRRIGPWAGVQSGLDLVNDREGLAPSPRPFGAEARELLRRKTFRASVRDAHIQINNFLGGRSVAELSEAEVEALSRQLLFQPSGMPHPRGYAKYQIFLKRIEREWKRSGAKVRISRRYQVLAPERSPFTEEAPGAIAKFEMLQAAAKTISEAGIGRMGIADCAMISACLLCLENRISDVKLLQDVAQGRNFRLVTLQGSHYLEYAEGLTRGVSDVPVRRFRVAGRTAAYLDRTLDLRGSLDLSRSPSQLEPIYEVMGAGAHAVDGGHEDFVRRIAAIADQANCITLPGVLAGYLSGRVETYAFNWRTWASRVLGYPIGMPKTGAEINLDDLGDEEISGNAAYILPQDVSLDELHVNAKLFLDEISSLLPRNDMADKATSTGKRRDVARQLQRVIESYEGRISSTIQLLGRWIGRLLFRKHRRKFIQLSSIGRYLSALRPAYLAVGYNADVLSMDEEDVTILYRQILDASEADDKQYVFERLADWHRFARREYAIEDPAWQELPDLARLVHVSPAAFGENEYQRALQLLRQGSPAAHISGDALATLLMLCYRFALRMTEALGITRADLEMNSGVTVIYVRNNRFRRLKTTTSRRQVPLLFKLSDAEVSLLAKCLADYEGRHGSDASQLLLQGEGSRPLLAERLRVSKIMNRALQIATSNPDATLHHARHSAANDVGRRVVKSMLRDEANGIASSQSDADSGLPARLLLGREGPTRRAVWGVCRYLGHVRRETTFRNYLHFVGEWYDATIAITNTISRTRLRNDIVLDGFPRQPEADMSGLEQLEMADQTNLSRIMMLMRLVARGRKASDAASALGLHPEISEKLESVLANVGTKLRLSNSKLSEKQLAIKPQLRLIQRMKEPAWNRLIDVCLKLDANPGGASNGTASARDWQDMIGATRQILAWDRPHFQFLRSFIDRFELSGDDYMLVISHQPHSELRKFTLEAGFVAAPIEQLKNMRHFQIDTAFTHDGRLQVKDRCALSIIESNSRAIRNSVELAICFIAFGILADRQDSQRHPPNSDLN